MNIINTALIITIYGILGLCLVNIVRFLCFVTYEPTISIYESTMIQNPLYESQSESEESNTDSESESDSESSEVIFSRKQLNFLKEKGIDIEKLESENIAKQVSPVLQNHINKPLNFKQLLHDVAMHMDMSEENKQKCIEFYNDEKINKMQNFILNMAKDTDDFLVEKLDELSQETF